MKVSILKKFALAATAATVFGAASQAVAAPQFTFDPTGSGSKTGVFPGFNADQFNGLSSELITFSNGGANAAASGYLYLTGASLAGSPAATFGRLGSLSTVGAPAGAGNYGMYLTFTLTNHLVQSTASGNVYQLDSLSFNWYLDTNNNTTFVAPVAETGTAATVNAASATDDLKIADGTLLFGTATIGNGGQQSVSLNSTESFVDVNQNYFTQPIPFFSILLSAFNNTSGAYTQSTSGQYGAINGAVGNVTFGVVPEPDTVALLGVATVALGLTLRRRKSKV